MQAVKKVSVLNFFLRLDRRAFCQLLSGTLLSCQQAHVVEVIEQLLRPFRQLSRPSDNSYNFQATSGVLVSV